MPNCHGSAGIPNPGIAKAIGVKAATDPAVKKMGEADMIAATRNDVGKMQTFKGKLTDEQIKDSVDYFRTFVKEAGKLARPTFLKRVVPVSL